MSCFLRLLGACACLATLHGAAAQEAGDGVVTTQALTVAGQDFCQYFIAAWRDKPASEQFSLAIRERASARWGSDISIEFAQRKVFQTRLPVARAALREAAAQAADATYETVLATERQRRLIRDADLAPDEF